MYNFVKVINNAKNILAGIYHGYMDMRYIGLAIDPASILMGWDDVLINITWIWWRVAEPS